MAIFELQTWLRQITKQKRSKQIPIQLVSTDSNENDHIVTNGFFRLKLSKIRKL